MKKVFAFMLAMVMSLSLVACGGTKETPVEETKEPAANEQTEAPEMEAVTLTLGTIYAADHPATLAVDAAIAEIKEASGGKITIEHYPASQLGDNDELAEGLVAGSVDFNVQSLSYFNEKCPEFEIDSCFFVYQDAEHVYNVWDGEIGAKFNSMAEENYGVTVLDAWLYGNRVMTTKNTPVRSPEDLAGLKMRVPDHAIWVDMMSSFGAEATPVAFSELYMALNQGVVDGQENPVPTIMSSKFDEVQDYLCLTNHKVETIYVMVNQDKWNSLSEEQRDIINTAFKNAREVNNEAIEQQTIDGVEAFEANGGTVIREDEIDSGAFADCVSKTLETKYPYLLDIYTEIQAAK